MSPKLTNLLFQEVGLLVIRMTIGFHISFFFGFAPTNRLRYLKRRDHILQCKKTSFKFKKGLLTLTLNKKLKIYLETWDGLKTIENFFHGQKILNRQHPNQHRGINVLEMRHL